MPIWEIEGLKWFEKLCTDRWKVRGLLPLARESQPGPSCLIPDPPQSVGVDFVPLISPTSSELDVERGLNRSEDELLRVCQDGGVPLLSFLLARAILPIASVAGPQHLWDPKLWVYRDLAHLPQHEQKEWQDTCLRELEALRRCNVYKLVSQPNNRKVIKNRWVFDTKLDGRKRVQLIAKGFSQVEGIDFDQIFSPVVCFETVYLIFSMATLEDWTISGLDVRNAFLYGKLDEEIFMEQPEGFHVQGSEHQVIHFKCALYGLKQAGLTWWRTLRESMEMLGFKSLISDAGLFIYKSNQGLSLPLYMLMMPCSADQIDPWSLNSNKSSCRNGRLGI